MKIATRTLFLIIVCLVGGLLIGGYMVFGFLQLQNQQAAANQAESLLSESEHLNAGLAQWFTNIDLFFGHQEGYLYIGIEQQSDQLKLVLNTAESHIQGQNTAHKLLNSIRVSMSQLGETVEKAAMQLEPGSEQWNKMIITADNLSVEIIGFAEELSDLLLLNRSAQVDAANSGATQFRIKSFLAIMAYVLLLVCGWLHAKRTLVRPLEQLNKHARAAAIDDEPPRFTLRSAPKEVLELSRNIDVFVDQLSESRRAIEQKAKRLLTSMEQRNAQILNAAGDGIFGLDAGGKILFVNTAAARLCGWVPDELEGSSIYKLSENNKFGPVSDVPAILSDHASLQTTPTQTRFWHRNGSDFAAEFITSCLPDSEAASGAVVVFRNVEARNSAQHQLRESESLKSGILSSSLDAVITFDADTKICEFNPAAENMFGITREKALNRREISALLPTDLLALLAATSQSPQQPQENQQLLDTRTETLAKRADGVEFPVELAVTTVGVEKQRYITVVMRDISTRKQREDELNAATNQARQASLAKSRFLANMSHEIRTPLNAIINISEFLRQGAPNEEQAKFAETVRDSGSALQVIVNDVLDYSKIEANKMDLAISEFNLSSLVESVLMLFRASISDNLVSIISDIDVPASVSVLGDSVRLRQILTNLVGNAVKFTAHGSVTVKITADDSSADKLSLKFQVIDTGIGIDLQSQNELFSEFTQVDASHSRSQPGTGLGLAICKRLVELMGGEIGVTSQPGQGSEFWFCIKLPVAENKLITQQDHTIFETGRSLDESKAGAVAKPTHAAMRVLLVEDSVTNQLVAKTILSHAGHSVEIAEDGLIAIDMANSQPFDVILMDLTMPILDGFSATDRIRQESGCNQNTPILALSANALDEDRWRCEAVGMDGFVAKPINKVQLLSALQSVTAVDKEPTGTASEILSLSA